MTQNKNSVVEAKTLDPGSESLVNAVLIGRLSPEATARLLSAEDEPVTPKGFKGKPYRGNATQEYIKLAQDNRATEDKRKAEWEHKNPTAAGIARAQDRKAKNRDMEGRKSPASVGLFAQALESAGINREDFAPRNNSQPKTRRRGRIHA